MMDASLDASPTDLELPGKIAGFGMVTIAVEQVAAKRGARAACLLSVNGGLNT